MLLFQNNNNNNKDDDDNLINEKEKGDKMGSKLHRYNKTLRWKSRASTTLTYDTLLFVTTYSSIPF